MASWEVLVRAACSRQRKHALERLPTRSRADVLQANNQPRPPVWHRAPRLAEPQFPMCWE